MRYLVDTGVWLRAFDKTDRHHGDVTLALKKLREQGHSFRIAPQIAAEFWCVCTRPSSSRGGYGLPPSGAAYRLAFIERQAEMIAEPESTYAAWKQLVAELKISGVKVHDARLAAIIVCAKLDGIVTLNPGDFRRFSEIAVVEPSMVVASGN